MKELLAVGFGGAMGSLARYGIMLGLNMFGHQWLPAATLLANVVGCFAIGWVTQWSIHHQLNSAWWVVGIRVGLLGGLTTFSSFALDVFREWHAGQLSFSVTLIGLHVVLGISAVAFGMMCAPAAATPEGLGN